MVVGYVAIYPKIGHGGEKMVTKGTKKKSVPKNVEMGIDSLGKFRKARTITSNGRGIRIRGPVKGGR